LIAELCAAFSCASLGIVPTVRHADYIGSWLEVMREDTREDDAREAWWYAAKRAAKKGYHPRTVRLYGDLNSLSDIQAMFDRCNVLWFEMLDWLEAGVG
jgi:antirestriction protein ArdC